MKKTILITGSTDGIGKATAKMLAQKGHHVLIHGRNEQKLAAVENELNKFDAPARIDTYAADISDFNEVVQLAKRVQDNHQSLDVLINNAGVYKVPNKTTPSGLDIRFAVNTIAPYLLTLKLIDTMDKDGRVINLSSAAQAPFDLSVFTKDRRLSDDAAYAQSKLALTMWSRYLAQTQDENSPAIIAVNPASFIGSKMVKDAYGVQGKDLQVGADILVKAALSDEFASASGLYFDNDKGEFANPHPDALDSQKIKLVTQKIRESVSGFI